MFCFVYFLGVKFRLYLSSSSSLNTQQEWNGSVGFKQSNCSGSGGRGKFGGAEAEQKEWNLASLLGRERFLLASFQKEVPQHSSKSYIMLLLVDYMQGALR